MLLVLDLLLRYSTDLVDTSSDEAAARLLPETWACTRCSTARTTTECKRAAWWGHVWILGDFTLIGKNCYLVPLKKFTVLACQLQKEFLRLKICWRYYIMTMFLMSSLLIESYKPPTEQAYRQFLIGIQILLQFLNELLVLRTLDVNHCVVVGLVADLVLSSLFFFHTFFHFEQIGVDWWEFIETSLRI